MVMMLLHQLQKLEIHKEDTSFDDIGKTYTFIWGKTIAQDKCDGKTEGALHEWHLVCLTINEGRWALFGHFLLVAILYHP